MRGYVFQSTAERFPLWLATIFNGALFGLMHINKVDSFPAAFQLIVSALITTEFLVLARLFTGSLWLAIGWHAAWNWVQGAVLGLSQRTALVRIERLAADSLVGSADMPEVGLAFILVEVVGVLVLVAWARRNGRPVDWQARLAATGQPK